MTLKGFTPLQIVHILCQEPGGWGMENLTKADMKIRGEGGSACFRISFLDIIINSM